MVIAVYTEASAVRGVLRVNGTLGIMHLGDASISVLRSRGWREVGEGPRKVDSRRLRAERPPLALREASRSSGRSERVT